MSTLVIGNSFNDHLVGDLSVFDPVERRIGGNISLRLAWLTEPGDVVVLPQEPDPDFLGYLMELKGIDPDSVTVLVPPPGAFGTDVLTKDRLLDADFQQLLGKAVADSGVDRILPYSFDSTVATLAGALGLSEGTPAFGFLAAGGSDLLNSKGVFRALAAGVGVPIADGKVTSVRAEAERFVWDLLRQSEAVIVKQDFHQGGHGNEILAPGQGVSQIGAAALTVLDSPAAVTRHFDERWPIYTNDHRRNTVLEHYLTDSVPLGAEVNVTDAGLVLHHVGEMRMTPIFDGMAFPGFVTSDQERRACGEFVLALCEPVRAMGFRGLINIDGIVSPDGRVLLTEFNGRLGGTTHLHWLGNKLVGPGYANEHVMVTANDWKVPSFTEALGRIRARGLAFDTATGAGVVISCDHVRQSDAVEYCVIAATRAAAVDIEEQVLDIFPPRQED